MGEGALVVHMIARFFSFALVLGLVLTPVACASSTGEAQSAQTSSTPVRFQGPQPADTLPHRTATPAQADAAYRALQAAFPGKEVYDFASLSCVHVQMPNIKETTTCIADDARTDDDAKAEALMTALGAAGAQNDMNNKMAAFTTRNVHATRDAFTFDDAANANLTPARNVRLEGKAAQDVMNAIAGAGVTEDDGTLFVICTKMGTGPTCAFQGHNAPGGALDAARSLALWNAFVHDAATTVLNASHFVWDGVALSFVGTLGTARPPEPAKP